MGQPPTSVPTIVTGTGGFGSLYVLVTETGPGCALTAAGRSRLAIRAVNRQLHNAGREPRIRSDMDVSLEIDKKL